MKTPAFCLIALAMSVSAFSQTSPPAAPTLTAGAQFKGLRFDWTPVAGASWYQFERRTHQNDPFVQQGDDLPATTTSTRFTFPLYFFDWTYARYRVAACNNAGCTRSAEVSLSNLRRDAVGYFKAAQPVSGAMFGDATDLSPDGQNMVVSSGETNGGTADTQQGGAVYVFGRDSNGKWVQRVRFQKDVVSSPEEPMAFDVGISASGHTVAVAMGNTQVPNSGGQEGQVDIHHIVNGVWTVTRLPRLPVQTFGTSLALDESGFYLAVGLGDPDNSVAIYKSINNVWTHLRDLSLTSQGYQEHCDGAQLSRDARVVLERCHEDASAARPARDYLRVYSGSNWTARTDIDLRFPASDTTTYFYRGLGMDRRGDTIAVQYSQNSQGSLTGTGAVRVYKRASGAYSLVTTLTPGSWRNSSWKFSYGDSVSVSGDGLTIAVGDWNDNGTGYGPRAAPLVSGTKATGAVYVYHYTDAWRLYNMVKPNYYPSSQFLIQNFGDRTSLNGDGRTMIVPVTDENSAARGIEGDWANEDAPYSGAVFMY